MLKSSIVKHLSTPASYLLNLFPEENIKVEAFAEALAYCEDALNGLILDEDRQFDLDTQIENTHIFWSQERKHLEALSCFFEAYFPYVPVAWLEATYEEVARIMCRYKVWNPITIGRILDDRLT